MPSIQMRAWCLTFWLEPKIKEGKPIRYAIYGKETCPDTGKLHWHGYIEFDKRMTMAGVKKLYDDKTIHVEVRKGTRDQAREYCRKLQPLPYPLQWEEFGDWELGGQGSRNDIKAVVELMEEKGADFDQIIMDNARIYCTHRNGLKDIQNIIIKRRLKKWREIKIHYLWGTTGTGKTMEAMKEGNATYKIHASHLRKGYWPKYMGEKKICIDEYDNQCPLPRLLGILDGHQYTAECKGGFVYAEWEEIWITSNLSPDELHPRAKPKHRAALFRRINGNGGGCIEMKHDVEMSDTQESEKSGKEEGEWLHGFFFPYEE